MKTLLLFMMTYSLDVLANSWPGENSLPPDQTISNLEKPQNKMIPGDRVLPTFHFEDEKIKKIAQEAQKKFQEVSKKTLIVQNAPKPRGLRPKRPKRKRPEIRIEVPSIKVFRRTFQKKREEEFIALPNGSTALISSRGGIEVEEGMSKKKKLDIRIEYSFLGPNEAVVELTGCMGWISVWGRYNTERIYGELEEISCRSPDGDSFTLKARGIIKDHKDEYVGAKGKFIANGKFSAMALSFLKDGTTEFGQALSLAQVQKDTVKSSEFVESGFKVSDEGKYIAGKSLSGATGRFLNWWVDFYTSQAPTLALAPGKKMFLTLSEEIQIPKKFFKDVKNHNTKGKRK